MKTEQAVSKLQFITRKKLKKFGIPCIILLAVIAVGYYLKSSVFAEKSVTAEIRTAVATTKDINTSLTGSGTMTSSNLTSIMVKASGTITKINVKQGDKVKKGDVISTLDTSDINSNVQKAQSNLDQILQTQATNYKDLANLNASAPITGQITNLMVNEGDTVQKNGILFTIINLDKMRLTIPFNGSDISHIKIGDGANVNLQNVMQSIKGKVTYISNAPYSTPNGGELYNVEITVNNPGSLTEGIKASADIDKSGSTISSADIGTLAFINKISVKSTTGGTVQKVNARVYDKVKSGAKVVILTNDDLTNSIENTKLKIKDAQDQLKNAKEQLANCTITAPIDGVITSVKSKVGDTVKMGDVLTSITDTDHMQFDISIDELDIAKIKVGQKVNVTVDAIAQTSVIPLQGEVSEISVQGESSNGVTTYPVTIKVTGVSNNFTNLMRNRMRNSSGGNGSGSQGQGFGNFRSNSNGNNSNMGGQNNQNASGGSTGQGNRTRNSSGQGNNGSANGGFNGMGGFGSNNGGNSSGGNQNRARMNLTSMLSELKDGMNANGEILIEENAGILTVPLEAVIKVNGKSYVMVKSDAKTIEAQKKSGKYIDIFNSTSTNSNSNRNNSNNNNQNSSNRNRSSNNGGSNSLNGTLNRLRQNKDYYKNSIPTEVEVGVNNDSDIQIVSGLKENQVILLPPLTASQSTSLNGGNSGMGGMFGLGGGGGQFSGGNNQNRVRSTGNGNNSNRSGGGN